ncbi:hypothetical protein CVT25_003279 [Psilocybe cyanescens]|uniref:Uncharacterized protein n=1 Tax=Psilocybe cyanescens TaxID=93625 RepID=A0A409WMF5_PSICY|nr:hypothetical protein CVT25_003279 [Psilocybe cyanescens]
MEQHMFPSKRILSPSLNAQLEQPPQVDIQRTQHPPGPMFDPVWLYFITNERNSASERQTHPGPIVTQGVQKSTASSGA